MQNFRTLEVWQRALKLAAAVSKATMRLPGYERHEIGAHMRASARSVHASIAEGCGRKVGGRSDADSLRLFGNASAELHELDSDVEYARDAGYWPSQLADPFLAEIRVVRMKLAALIAYRRSRRRRRGDEGIDED